MPILSQSRRPGISDDDVRGLPRLPALLARNAQFTTPPQVLSKKTFSQALILYDLTAVSQSPASMAASAFSPSAPVLARVVALDSSIIWMWVAGIAMLSLTVIFSMWFLRRSAVAAGVFGRRANNAVVLDLSPFSVASDRDPFARLTTESCSGSAAEGAGAQATLWRTRAIRAEQRADQTTAMVREGLMQQMGRLMRERMIGWLSSQRNQLLTSHEVGTRQVLELEGRLQKIQVQFEEQLQAREQRIADLERGIQEKERVIRELLRSQVRIATETPENGS